MSRKIKQKTKALADRERELKEELTGKSVGLKSRAARVGKIALVSGLVSFILFALYRVFFQDERPKKNRRNRSLTIVIVENLIILLTPYLKVLLERAVKRKKEK